MSTENKILDISLPADESLVDDQYKFVVRTATGCRRPDSALEIPEGILQNAPDIGEAAVIRKIGISKLQAGGALTLGTFVQLEYNSASDAGKGISIKNDYGYISALCLDPAVEDELASVVFIQPIRSKPFNVVLAATDATAGALTYTAAMLRGGLLLRDPNGGSRSDVTPTAALIVAAIPGAIVGSSFEFTIRNTADAGETITVTAGSGVTLSGTMTIAQNNSKRFLVICDNVTVSTEAVTIYSLGTITT